MRVLKLRPVESHINESHINDVQAAYQLLPYVLGSSHIKDKSHINDVLAADVNARFDGEYQLERCDRGSNKRHLQ